MTQRYGSGGPWEETYGYSRIVATDDHAWVAGCTSVIDGAVIHDGDAAAQARTAFDIAIDALVTAGFEIGDVVRTRMFVVDVPRNGDAVARVHGEMFADVRPASTMVGVTALVDPRLVVEVEVDAHR